VLQGAAEKNKTGNRRTSAPARKKKVRFGAFLGKGSSKTEEFLWRTFPKNSPGKYFFGGLFLVFFLLFSFYFLLLRWLSASR
jgi:hypothetical protein